MSTNTLFKTLSQARYFAFYTALLLALLLYAYRAFGIEASLSASGHSLVYRSFWFGLLMWFSTFTWELLLEHSKLWKRRLVQYVSSLVFMFFALNYFWLGRDWHWLSFLSLAFDLLLFWPVPVFIHWFSLKYSLAADADQGVNRSSEQSFYLSDENGRKQISLDKSQFLYAAADGNYLDLHINRGQGVEVLLFRKSLKHLEEQYPEDLIRIHRKYLVSLHAIEAVNWHSKDGMVQLKGGLSLKIGSTYLVSVREAWGQSLT